MHGFDLLVVDDVLRVFFLGKALKRVERYVISTMTTVPSGHE